MRIHVTYADGAPRVIETSGESLLSSSAMERSPEWLGTGLPVIATMLRPRTDLICVGDAPLVVEVCAWSAADAGGRRHARVKDFGNVTDVPRLAFHVFRVWEVLPAEEVARAVAIDIDDRVHVRRLAGRLMDLTCYERLEADLLSATERGGLALDQRVSLVLERLRALEPGASDEELARAHGLGGALLEYAARLAGAKGDEEDGAISDVLEAIAAAGTAEGRAEALAEAMLADDDLDLRELAAAAVRRGMEAGDVAALWDEASAIADAMWGEVG